MIVKCIFIWTVVCSIQLASSSGATETKACDDHSNCMCNVVMLNCSSNNLQTEDLAKPFPKVHRDVYLNHNLLTALDDNHMSHFVSAENLYLDHNDLNYIEVDTFQHNVQLRRISLNNNELSTLHENMFANNPEIETVILSYNQIEVIPEGLFNHLEHLKHLRLNNNRIRSIPDGAFQATVVLDILYLENNELETARWKWINHFDTVEPEGYELFFDLNPISCDCRMTTFYKKMKSKHWNVQGEHKNIEWPTCNYPTSLKGVNLLNVSSEANLVCELPEFEDSHQQYNFGGNEEVTITCKHYGTPTPTMFITGFNGEIVSAVQKSV